MLYEEIQDPKRKKPKNIRTVLLFTHQLIFKRIRQGFEVPLFLYQCITSFRHVYQFCIPGHWSDIVRLVCVLGVGGQCVHVLVLCDRFRLTAINLNKWSVESRQLTKQGITVFVYLCIYKCIYRIIYSLPTHKK